MELMTAKAMAEYMQVSVKTIREYGKAGIIGTIQPRGKGCAIRYYLKENANGEKN